MATGTGKTRVAVSLCDALIRARWVKRVLFLCDRRELRKQAANDFKEHLPAESRTIVAANTAGDRNKRIYLATYPAMMKCFEKYDVGFFDLIIADESHRSIYRQYSVLFEYFDALQVGLTATPVDRVDHNTFDMFGCNDQDPTAHFSYEQAIAHDPPWLTPFVVDTHTTEFLRSGVKYSEMSDEQRRRLEEDEELPHEIEFEQPSVDRLVFNKDTNRHILRNLMEHGVRIAGDSRVGKTIVFARSHEHALLLQRLFDEMYPQYAGNFCRVIDSFDPRADELITEFKKPASNLTLAVSVDMLDTGIDVPEIVNLVFAKPVYSYVKFWQMIGRGTRLCENLFGPGRDKTHFQIFDHWGNFERFEQGYTPAPSSPAKSIMQLVFESRIELADAGLQQQSTDAFDLAVELIGRDVASLPERSLPVRDKWREVQSVSDEQTLKRFDAATRAVLRRDVAPLMQWVNISGYEAAYRFDRLVAELQTELIRGSSRFDDLRDELVNHAAALPLNLNQVRARQETIQRVQSPEFWDHVTVRELEEVRREIRGLMQFRPSDAPPRVPPRVVDVAEDESLIRRERRPVRLEGLDMVAYRNRVQAALLRIFDENETLQKIKSGLPVDAAEIEDLCALVLTQETGLDLHDLADYYPEAGGLEQALRSIIGRDARDVSARFTRFIQEHPGLNSHQIRFLDLLQNHISRYGAVEVERLYEDPFTLVDSDGLDGVFDDPLAGEVLDLVDSFRIADE